MDAFEKVSQLLSEMQIELGRRAWSDDVHERIQQAMEFRGKLSDAIFALRDEDAARMKP